jgi:hypothetical protein
MAMSEDEQGLFEDVEQIMGKEGQRAGMEVVDIYEGDIQFVIGVYQIRREYAMESLIKYKLHLDAIANAADMPLEQVKEELSSAMKEKVLALCVGKTIGIHCERGDFKQL